MSVSTYQADMDTIVGYFNDPKKWEVKTNRHRTLDGKCWGWIEGLPGNVCWSDDDNVFDHNKAAFIVKLHNMNVERMGQPKCRDRAEKPQEPQP